MGEVSKNRKQRGLDPQGMGPRAALCFVAHRRGEFWVRS